MKTITIQGKEYAFALNMQACILYERMTQKSAFDIAQFQSGLLEPIAALGYAILLSNNAPEEVPDMDKFYQSIADIQTATTLFQAVGEEISSFYQVMDGDKTTAKKKGDKKGNR